MGAENSSRGRSAQAAESLLAKQMRVESGKKKGRTEYVFYISATLISIALIVYLWSQPWAYTKTGDGLSMAAFPTVFAAGLLIASMTGAILKGRQEEHSQPSPKEEPPLLWPVILLGGGVIASTLGLWYFDAVISSSLLVFFLLFAGRVRDWRLLAGISVGTGLLLYVLFILVLGVYFPRGWLR